MPPFVYGKAKKKPAVKKERQAPPKASKIEPKQSAGEMGLIKGKKPQSRLEWNVSIALAMLGWDYDYQVPVLGGHEVRGGMVLDFLVHTIPAYTPMPVNGRYWHRDEDDQLKIEAMLAALKRYGYPVGPAVIVWEENARDVDDAYQFIFSKIGKG